MIWWIVAVLVAALVLLAWRLSSKAGRLDRLHRRIDSARGSLELALLRRASVVTEVAGTMLPDPGSAALLADAACEARRAADSDPAARSLTESNLSAVLAATFDDAETVEGINEALGGTELMDELGSACRGVDMTRRFLNDAVRATIQVHKETDVRWFRLAGHTGMPASFDMAATVPAGFGIR